ncbi:hypothetical protein G6045_37280 [Streptomyces sp. YC504]|uniref:Uncharacterized protein n=1 Tax=Streptomyces mesophilus TaxID=1775132 RepID=A0A6G4XWU0_9ACTN|nr:hypothetical protein [Streptomyces mesophilus]NGO81277.1 hypothetical protein [Streptomyces mesophilus]
MALGLVAAFGALAGGLAAPAHAAAPETPERVSEFSFTSAEGDPIGMGRSETYTPDNATFEVYGNKTYVRVGLNTGPGDWWDVTLGAPQGEELEPRVHREAERHPFQTGRSPGLSVGGEGRGCNEIWGSFELNQYETDAEGNPLLVDASFEQRCEAADAPPLKGRILWQAYPLSYTYESDPDDPVGQGMSGTHYGATSLFKLQGRTTEGIVFDVSGKREDWSVEFLLHAAGPLEVGHTYRTTDDITSDDPTLMVSGNGRACSGATGTFTVTKLEADPDGAITAVAADYEQKCGTGVMRGTLHYYA